MGEVLLCYDVRLHAEVAVKRVPTGLAGELRTFLSREAQILVRLNHPNIVRIFDLAETHEGQLLVLEYVCGPSLDNVLGNRGSLNGSELLYLMSEICAGLSDVHAKGVVHRDLKPSNILMSLPGGERSAFLENGSLPSTILNSQIKIADFGISKLLSGTIGSTAHNVSGTPRYMAPEQFQGDTISAQTDVYALGGIAYECISGKPPFTVLGFAAL
jgi:serine/threonine-protein kinase